MTLDCLGVFKYFIFHHFYIEQVLECLRHPVCCISRYLTHGHFLLAAVLVGRGAAVQKTELKIRSACTYAARKYLHMLGPYF